MTAETCPRCRSKETLVDFRGEHDGELVWTIHRCHECCYSWRDSEPASTIDPAARASQFAVDVSDPDRFPKILQQLPGGK